MSWPAFVVMFSAVTFAALVVARRRFDGHWANLVQVTIFVTCLTFLIDYPAEERAFWTFGTTSGWLLLDTPVENHVFVAACAVDIMIVYLSLRRYLRDSNHEDGSPTLPPTE